MLLEDIVRGVNTRLAGELLSYYDLRPHLDSAIDDINTQLNACFPAFSELGTAADSYTAFPDKWIRMVVMPGAAYYYYIMDEEGGQPPPGLQQIFLQNLFFMLRDYIQDVPYKYRAGSHQGTAPFALYDLLNPEPVVASVAPVDTDSDNNATTTPTDDIVVAINQLRAQIDSLGALAYKEMIGTSDIDASAITNAKLVDMLPFTVKGRNASTVGIPGDVTMLDVAEYALYQGTPEAAPADTDFVPLSVSATLLKKLSWASVKAALKTYFDTMFAGLTNGKVKPDQACSSVIEITANTVLGLAHAGAFLKVDHASACTVTIPTDAAVAFPLGTEIEFMQYGEGSVTFAAASGVTLKSPNDKVLISDRYDSVGLKKIGTNEWQLIGKLK